MTYPPNAFAPNAFAPKPFTPPIRQPIAPPPGLPGEPVDAPPDAPESRKASKPEMAVLRFLDPEALKTVVPLKHPFFYEADGGEVLVTEVTIRRMAVAEVGVVVCKWTDKRDIDVYVFYEVMTGLPAAVLRAMPDDEGVIEACVPFMPAAVRDLLSALTPRFGVATPSPAPEPAASRSAAS